MCTSLRSCTKIASDPPPTTIPRPPSEYAVIAMHRSPSLDERRWGLLARDNSGLARPTTSSTSHTHTHGGLLSALPIKHNPPTESTWVVVSTSRVVCSQGGLVDNLRQHQSTCVVASRPKVSPSREVRRHESTFGRHVVDKQSAFNRHLVTTSRRRSKAADFALGGNWSTCLPI